MKLKGNNLGERQHYFNEKVNDGISMKIKFPAIMDDPLDTDIDYLFKIDIASHLKDVTFLLQTLISGDSLYISRALKSVWLFDDEYQHIMNPDYLSKNTFPQMSDKMVKKLLTTASKCISNEKRAEKFFLYCKENGMHNIAVKFVVSTDEAFKESVLQNDFVIVKHLDDHVVQFLIGKSFALAVLYLSKARQYESNRVLHQLRFLYFIDSDKYLDMLEINYIPLIYNSTQRFGLRISKDILKTHKERILNHPQIYMTLLNKSSIVKYSNSENAKFLLKALLPDGCETFWHQYMNQLEFIIKLIPLSDRYEFFKKIYVEKYGSAFEMNRELYNRGYYVHMTEEQQEKWALDQLASKKEMLGASQDFLWYKFVRFDIAFEDIKKLILITKEDRKRMDMLCVLVECVRNSTQLEKLLNHFCERHGNEMENCKNNFLDCVVVHHNIFKLDQNSWNVFNKILYGLDIYNAQKSYKSVGKMIALFYHILHDIELPEVLRCWLIDYLHYIPSKIRIQINHYDRNGADTIYNYILKVYTDELCNLEKQEYNDEVAIKAENAIFNIDRLRRIFYKRDDLPEVVIKFEKLQPEIYTKQEKTRKNDLVNPQEFVRMLKKDAILALNFDLLERNIQYSRKYNIKKLLQKLRIYFHDDIAQQYLEYFRKAYSKEDHKVIFVSVLGIMLLADEKFKTEFILQHAPEDAKVQFDEIDRNELYIREAICRFACYSRPCIEIDYMLKYIKGDYLQYCIPMFNVYMTRYPPAMRMKFVKSLLNTPVSIHKHGIRLAFQCFKTDDLTDLVLNSWKKYQNVSLRMTIYKYVFGSVKKCEATRKEMFKVLKKITLDLKEDECEEINKIFIDFRDFPYDLKGLYLDAVWTAIIKFSNCKLNIKAKANVISSMAEHVNCIPKESIKKVVTAHVEEMLVKNKIIPDQERSIYEGYDKAAWALTHAFICEYFEDEYILELVKFIIQKCAERWNDAHFDHKRKKNVFVFKNFCFDFTKTLEDNSLSSNNSAVGFNRILESVLAYLIDSVPKREIFVIMMNLKIVMLANRVLEYACTRYKNCEIDKEEIDDIAKEYVTKLESLVKEIIQNKLYSTAFTIFLSDVIVSNVKRISPHLPKCQYHYEKLIILIASNLADSSLVEIVLLAVAVSSDFSCDETHREWNNFNILQNKIAKIDIDEVQYFMNIQSFGRPKRSNELNQWYNEAELWYL